MLVCCAGPAMTRRIFEFERRRYNPLTQLHPHTVTVWFYVQRAPIKPVVFPAYRYIVSPFYTRRVQNGVRLWSEREKPGMPNTRRFETAAATLGSICCRPRQCGGPDHMRIWKRSVVQASQERKAAVHLISFKYTNILAGAPRKSGFLLHMERRRGGYGL